MKIKIELFANNFIQYEVLNPVKIIMTNNLYFNPDDSVCYYKVRLVIFRIIYNTVLPNLHLCNFHKKLNLFSIVHLKADKKLKYA